MSIPFGYDLINIICFRIGKTYRDGTSYLTTDRFRVDYSYCSPIYQTYKIAIKIIDSNNADFYFYAKSVLHNTAYASFLSQSGDISNLITITPDFAETEYTDDYFDKIIELHPDIVTVSPRSVRSDNLRFGVENRWTQDLLVGMAEHSLKMQAYTSDGSDRYSESLFMLNPTAQTGILRFTSSIGTFEIDADRVTINS